MYIHFTHTRLIKTISILFVICIVCSSAFAQKVWNVPAGGVWNIAGNWSPAGVPAITDSVKIDCNCTVTLSGNADAKQLYIATGSILNVTGNNQQITIGAAGVGSLTLSGELGDNGTAGNKAPAFNGSLIKGTGKYTLSQSFSLAAASSVSIQAGSDLTWDGTTKNPKIDMNGGTIHNYGTMTLIILADLLKGTFVNHTGGRLNYNNDRDWPSSGGNTVTLDASATDNIVYFGCPKSPVVNVKLPPATAFWDLIIAGAAGTIYKLDSSPTIGGDLTIETTGTLDANAGTKNLTIQGNWINDGVFTQGVQTVTFDGTTTVSGTTTTTFYNATINATKTLTGHATNMNVSNNWVNNGTFTHNSGTVTFTGTTTISGSATTSFCGVTISGTLTAPSAASMNVACTWTNNGTFTHNNSTVTFTGSSQQTHTGSAGTTFYNFTNSNSAGITLGSNITINNSLSLNANVIVTNSYKVILPSTGSLSRTTGFVQGNLQKNVATGATSRTFEVGTSSTYSPVTVAFASVTVAGDLICSATGTEHPNINASTIDPAKSVNRYWTITNSAITFTTADITFTFVAGDIDGGANTSVFGVQRTNGITWSTTTAGTRTATTTQFTGEPVANLPNGSARDYGIGEVIVTTDIYTRLSGAVNWNSAATWIQNRTGTITFTNASTAVTGVGTKFCGIDGICGNADDEIVNGDILMIQASCGTIRGTVSGTPASNTSLTLAANATATISGAYGREQIPSTADQITYIGNPNVTTGVTVSLDVDATINQLIFYSHTSAISNILSHNAGKILTIQSSATVNQPSVDAQTYSWNINTGTATVGGNLIIGSNNSTATRVGKVVLTTGTLNITGNLVYNSPVGSASPAVIDLSGGAATVNLSGSMTLANTTGTLTPGTTSIFNYNRTSSAQTVIIGTSAITYANLHCSNTSASGATLSAAITTTNVTGNLRVLSGKLSNGGFAVAGNAKIFEVASGATFALTGNSSTSTFPSGFTTFTFGSTSNIRYQYTATSWSVANQSYGNLYIEPAANGLTATFPAATITIAGSLTCGNGTNTATTAGTATTTLNITGGVTNSTSSTITATNIIINTGGDFSNSGTFTAGAAKKVKFNGSVAQSITGSSNTTFSDIEFANTSTGVTVSKPTTVTGTMTLTTALVHTDAVNLLMLTSTASSASSGSLTCYVDGPMTKTGNTAFIFPIGRSGKWARFGITFSGGSPNVTTEYDAEFIYTSSPNPTLLGSGIDKVSGTRYWEVSRPVGSSSTDNIYATLYWEDGATVGINQLATLKVAHYNSSTSLWENKGGTTTGTTSVGTVTATTALSSFSPISFGNGSGGTNPLPIELIEFTAVLNSNKQVDVKWVTATETNNDYFTVERGTWDGGQGASGIQFHPIATVKGAGNSSTILHYSIVDNAPLNGISYYRLKQTDYDGKYTYSYIVPINISEASGNTFVVFPNPANMGDPIQIRMNSDEEKSVLVVLTDLTGKEIFSKVVIIEKGNDSVTAIDPDQKLAPGMYTITSTSDNSIYNQKLIIK